MATDRAQLADLARQLQAAYDRSGEDAQAFTLSLYADTVVQTHTPAQSDDGLWDRTDLVARSEAGFAMTRTMPHFRLEGVVSTEGDDIVVMRTITMTSPEGNEVSTRVRSTMTVENGRVVRVHGDTTVDGDPPPDLGVEFTQRMTGGANARD